MKIQAAVSRGLGRPLSIEEVDLAQPQRDEVLIRLVASGVCHTDAESINGRELKLIKIELVDES